MAATIDEETASGEPESTDDVAGNSTGDTTAEAVPEPVVHRVAVERHRRGNRWMHWINFPLLTIMIWSGLRIYWADLRDNYVLGIGGQEFFTFLPDWINGPLGFDRKLARGMAFHFSFGWLFVLNALAFAIYLSSTGGWRNFIPSLRGLRTIPAVLAHEVGLRKERPPQGKYNVMQQLTYGLVLLMGLVAIVTGFAIYKPTQLALLTRLLGGYESARFLHFVVTIAFVVFFVIHVLQVVRAGFSTFWAMVCGYELEDRPERSWDSPEAEIEDRTSEYVIFHESRWDQ